MKISDAIANFLEEKEIRHVFGIIGAGNAHIFDSIFSKGYTEIVCVHHEQAACMAMQTYYRLTGKVTAALLTTGAGSTNGTTGVVSAWADSIPGIVISGNENSKFIDLHKDVRMWGVQGYDSPLMVEKVTKYAGRVLEPKDILVELNKSWDIATEGRPGPVWLDIPMNIQSAVIDESAILPYEKPAAVLPSKDLPSQVSCIVADLKAAKRPLLWLGHGIRLAEATELIEPLLEQLGAPSLVTWAGIDMVDS
jgi:acetolactate synthase-1/2/3 large subunit